MSVRTLVRRSSACLAAAGVALAAGTGVAHAATSVSAEATVATNCVWAGDAGGCWLTTNTAFATEILVSWAGGAHHPLVNGAGPLFCVADVGSAGTCAYAVTTGVVGGKVTVTADLGSAGVATEQNSL